LEADARGGNQADAVTTSARASPEAASAGTSKLICVGETYSKRTGRPSPALLRTRRLILSRLVGDYCGSAAADREVRREPDSDAREPGRQSGADRVALDTADKAGIHSSAPGPPPEIKTVPSISSVLVCDSRAIVMLQPNTTFPAVKSYNSAARASGMQQPPAIKTLPQGSVVAALRHPGPTHETGRGEHIRNRNTLSSGSRVAVWPNLTAVMFR
jgi:hypothetical protein